MNAINFSLANTMLSAEGCDDLPVCASEMHGLPVMVSCWEPSEEDIQLILKNKRVFLWVWGSSHPPVAVTAIPPEIDCEFTKRQKPSQN